MHVVRVVATIALLLFVASTGFAQSTGANVMSALGETIRREMTAYQVIGTRDVIRVIDRKSGVEVLTVTEAGPQNVSITASIGKYPGMTRDARAIVAERIALFNFSSLVGTLEFNERNGAIIMSHNLNPSAVSIKEMAHVASLCIDVAREQSRSMMQKSRSTIK
ncbi:MAG: hypothetical protein H7X80_00200 [bacterium]|nr:hypothetical protein [Candidatus Kapabacteria bacterium]